MRVRFGMTNYDNTYIFKDINFPIYSMNFKTKLVLIEFTKPNLSLKYFLQCFRDRSKRDSKLEEH